MDIETRRVYALKGQDKDPDRYLVLLDRLWPRGIAKADLPLDEWARELAPSDELRRWFGHDPQRWAAFKAKYRKELENEQEQLRRLREIAEDKTLVLLYGARDEQRNQARVLAELLQS
jgi:uncharacterized protein YeaO (DUF488 family)